MVVSISGDCLLSFVFLLIVVSCCLQMHWCLFSMRLLPDVGFVWFYTLLQALHILSALCQLLLPILGVHLMLLVLFQTLVLFYWNNLYVRTIHKLLTLCIVSSTILIWDMLQFYMVVLISRKWVVVLVGWCSRNMPLRCSLCTLHLTVENGMFHFWTLFLIQYLLLLFHFVIHVGLLIGALVFLLVAIFSLW